MPDLEYVVIVHADDESGFWTEVPSLPGVGSQGETMDEAVENTREAMALLIEYLREKGEPVPRPNDAIVKVTVAA